MKRAIAAGVETIEHGDDLDAETAAAMKRTTSSLFRRGGS